MVTQCPACGSRFRITGNQLGRAGGRVRCGACLAIFLAADVPKVAGKVRSSPGEPRLAQGAPDTNRWVRWALVVAVLILFLQLALYLT